jgi:LSD1 subclass zinc finger protein
LQDAKKKYDQAMQASRQTHARLAEPPGLLLRGWSSAAEGLAALLGFLLAVIIAVNWVGVVVALAILYLGLHSLADDFGVNLNDVYGAHSIYFVAAVAFSAVVVLPQVLTAWVKDVIALRATLQASLAARFPVETPGQAACRGCAAPLDVPAAAACVRCPFCDSDNLTSIAPERLADVAQFAHWHFRSVDDAVRREREFRRDSRHGLVTWGFGTLVGGALAAALGAGLQLVDIEPDPPSWSQLTVQAAALVVDHHGTAFASQPLGTSAPIPVDAEGYWLALRRGDTVRLQTPDLRPMGMPTVTNTTSFEDAVLADELTWRPEGGAFIAVFRAPYTGRFCVRPRVARDQATPPWLRIDVVRGPG